MKKIIYVTCKDLAEAKYIANELVKDQLAECVNINENIFSIYHWQGQTHQEPESSMLIKTNNELINQVISKIKDLHSYQEPAILSWNVD